MISQAEINNRYFAQRFDEWTTDWTLPWLFWALLTLDPLIAWPSSFAVAVAAGELRWFIYPVRVWSNTLVDMGLTIGRWGLGLFAAWKLWEVGRVVEALACVAILKFLDVVYFTLAMLVSDSRRVRQYQTHHHNVFFRQFGSHLP